jgi:redox-sensitive bicupin YhaK (pirin superfamily)
MVETRYQDLRAGARPVIERAGVRIDVISGVVDGVAGPAANDWSVIDLATGDGLDSAHVSTNTPHAKSPSESSDT